MPKLNGWYPRKKPLLQVRILKLIASTGCLSQKQATARFRCKPSTISEAFKIMETRSKLIQRTNAPQLDSGIRREKFYKLSPHGLLAFIDENPSPQEFWIAIIWYSSFNPQDVDRIEFNRYYNLFIAGFVGNFPLRSCFFLGNLFEELFQQWCKGFDDRYYHSRSMMLGYTYYETRKAYKVLECLLLNRGITTEKIVNLTKLTEEEIRKVLKDYSIIQSSYYQYADDYESVYQSTRSIAVTTDLLNHLLIVPTGGYEAEGRNNGKCERYELSLVGVLLMLATISLMRQRREGFYYVDYYSKVASNYQEKLPLIFGKWGLLKNILNFEIYPSIFDYLLSGYKSEILSLSVALGGNKEIYDNIRSATLNTINKFFMVYDDGISALESGNYPQEFVNTQHCRFMKEKLNEIEISLKYTDLESFAKYMKDKIRKSESNSDSHALTFKNMPTWRVNIPTVISEENFPLKDDLHVIENALADEFSFSFYVGLLRDNNHKASDYPLTTGFMRQSSNLVYPKWLLMRILKGNKEIRNRLTEWIKEALRYQKQAFEKMDEIFADISD